jgi:hypothetical protein
MAAKKFGVAKPCALSGAELDSLTVGGTGLNLAAKLGPLEAVTGDSLQSPRR